MSAGESLFWDMHDAAPCVGGFEGSTQSVWWLAADIAKSDLVTFSHFVPYLTSLGCECEHVCDMKRVQRQMTDMFSPRTPPVNHAKLLLDATMAVADSLTSEDGASSQEAVMWCLVMSLAVNNQWKQIADMYPVIDALATPDQRYVVNLICSLVLPRYLTA